MEKKKSPKTVRFESDQADRISAIQRQMRGGFAGALRLVIEKGLEGLDARPIAEGAPREEVTLRSDAVPLPIVAEDVGAGRQGRLPVVPEPKPYYFREDWLRRKGWAPEHADRFVCVRLGVETIADSMFPTIQPESVVLIDRGAGRKQLEPRSIWIVNVPGEGLLMKRVTIEKGLAVLESDNPEPEYAPRIVRCDHERERLLYGQVNRGDS